MIDARCQALVTFPVTVDLQTGDFGMAQSIQLSLACQLLETKLLQLLRFRSGGVRPSCSSCHLRQCSLMAATCCHGCGRACPCILCLHAACRTLSSQSGCRSCPQPPKAGRMRPCLVGRRCTPCLCAPPSRPPPRARRRTSRATWPSPLCATLTRHTPSLRRPWTRSSGCRRAPQLGGPARTQHPTLHVCKPLFLTLPLAVHGLPGRAWLHASRPASWVWGQALSCPVMQTVACCRRRGRHRRRSRRCSRSSSAAMSSAWRRTPPGWTSCASATRGAPTSRCAAGTRPKMLAADSTVQACIAAAGLPPATAGRAQRH